MAPVHHGRVAPGVLLAIAALSPAPARGADPFPTRCGDCHDAEKLDPGGPPSRHVLPCRECHRAYGEICREGAPFSAASASPREAKLVARAKKDPVAAASCVACHEDEVLGYERSVHGRALGDGKGDAPYCFECHGPPHGLRPVVESDAARRILLNAACIRCHDDPELTDANELNPEVAGTYVDSTHGKLVTLGKVEGAACWDCHGAHAVLAKDEPGSMVGTASVAATCGKCHEGATASFATAFMHRPLSGGDFVIGHAIEKFFGWLTFLTIGALMAHIALDLFHQIRIRLAKKREPER